MKLKCVKEENCHEEFSLYLYSESYGLCSRTCDACSLYDSIMLVDTFTGEQSAKLKKQKLVESYPIIMHIGHCKLTHTYSL